MALSPRAVFRNSNTIHFDRQSREDHRFSIGTAAHARPIRYSMMPKSRHAFLVDINL